MKIPFIPVHVVTSKTLNEKLAAARAEGVAEGKAFRVTQINKLLSANAAGPIGIRQKRNER